MRYEQLFVVMKERVLNDLSPYCNSAVMTNLGLALSQHNRTQAGTSDQYRSKAAKVPAYYNPNTHTIHLNISVLESTTAQVVENIYYHELVHAASHHARLTVKGRRVLKSGLKVQLWDEENKEIILNRGLNEGMTQYLANTFTEGGPAYRREVAILGRIIQRIGLADLRAAYFGPAIDQLEKKMAVTFGPNVLNQLSAFLDRKDYETAEALIS